VINHSQQPRKPTDYRQHDVFPNSHTRHNQRNNQQVYFIPGVIVGPKALDFGLGGVQVVAWRHQGSSLAMCPRNPLRRTLVARALSGMRVCSNITICCLPAVLVDLHAHAACLDCVLPILARHGSCSCGSYQSVLGPGHLQLLTPVVIFASGVTGCW
jgi:hypothetical protein